MPNLDRLSFVHAVHKWLNPSVDHFQTGKNILNIREARDNRKIHLGGALSCHKARVLPRFKILVHGRHHDHQRGEGITRARLPGFGSGAEFLYITVKQIGGSLQHICIRERFAKINCTVLVEIGCEPAHTVNGVGAP
ncbi:hypothetical protein SDC9_85642 [bioreactor metagenome]|uniref:Uncharacterized protein n=1 Tax=bioreactor metagenome TaxID=1076179 RepID=A0A644ZGK2_9ZZZZ